VALIGRTGDLPGHRLSLPQQDHRPGTWHTAEQVEIATLKYVDWFNHRRLLEACEDILFELEQAHYRQ
jgi:hypothetical protein